MEISFLQDTISQGYMDTEKGGDREREKKRSVVYYTKNLCSVIAGHSVAQTMSMGMVQHKKHGKLKTDVSYPPHFRPDIN
jgi:hypothetical protein